MSEASKVSKLMTRFMDDFLAAQELMEVYIKKFTDVKDHLQIYNDSLRLDSTFFKKNLLALNIYLREMSIEVMKQRQTYSFFSLLSDIGGTLGLFLGASLLTVAEIFDYFISHIFYMCGYKKSEYHENSSDESSNDATAEFELRAYL